MFKLSWNERGKWPRICEEHECAEMRTDHWRLVIMAAKVSKRSVGGRLNQLQDVWFD